MKNGKITGLTLFVILLFCIFAIIFTLLVLIFLAVVLFILAYYYWAIPYIRGKFKQKHP